MRGWVLITGCSSGIGRALVAECRRTGWGVVATARRLEALADLMPGEDLRLLRLDITDPASLEAAVGACSELPLKALINNAGYGQMGPLEALRPQELRAQLETNVVGLHAATCAFLPLIRCHAAPGEGRIVHIASVLGRFSIPMAGAYNASKHAVVALAETLRLEIGREVPVILVEPGAIRSEFRNTLMKAWGDLPERLQGTPYAQVLESYRRQREDFARDHGLSAEAAAECVVRALNARRPPRRVPVGRDALAVSLLRRLVPDCLWEKVLRRMYGL
nr:SDR family oxidoreductase [uncultured Holophaga sp.]